MLVLPFNDADACAEIINENADDLAAVIVDPLATGAGTCIPVDGFLTRLRELTTQTDALLVFDEIISFRASPGGAQELYSVQPDLTCMAKVIAGGTAGAAFGGRPDVMELYSPFIRGEDSSIGNLQRESYRDGRRACHPPNHDAGGIRQNRCADATVGSEIGICVCRGRD